MLRRFMLKAKETEEFDKWWKHWISTLAQSRTVVKHPVSENKSGDDLECTADGAQKPAA
jgi:hypothetical protein